MQPYRVHTGFEKVWNLIKYWKSMEKRKQSMENYVFPDFCPYLV